MSSDNSDGSDFDASASDASASGSDFGAKPKPAAAKKKTVAVKAKVATRTTRSRKVAVAKKKVESDEDEDEDAEGEDEEVVAVSKTTTRTRRGAVKKELKTDVVETKVEEKVEEKVVEEKVAAVTKPTRKRKAPVKDSASDDDDDATPLTTTTAVAATSTKTTTTVAKKTRTKKATTSAMPLAARTAGLALHIGAHVSAAKGVHNAITNSAHIGSNSLALFLKSQRKWTSPPLKAADITAFKAAAAAAPYDVARHVLPHGSYLVNLAQPDAEKATQAYNCFLDDLARCEQLGIALYNFHPGSTLGAPRAEALGRVAAALNKAHAATKSVVTVLENMAGAGNVIGCAFEDLRDIIADVTDKARVGVCLDTCHMFAAGHDIRTREAYEATMKSFDEIVGLKYLRAWHLNDSKAPLGSKRDLHANIGTGYIGLEAFRLLMNDERVHGMPMVLETPLKDDDVSTWAEEIKMLEGLVGVDGADEKFLEQSKELQEKGEAERKRVGEQVDKKTAKAKPKAKAKAAVKAPAKGRAKKKAKVEESEPEDEEGCDSCSEH
ncbi:xylose isomerase-like protein [Geopyxis carbonaria]|nr:xylose isomerase-like protein [Geopyxis carbonaria]